MSLEHHLTEHLAVKQKIQVMATARKQVLVAALTSAKGVHGGHREELG